jgi:hypothetical protein
MYKGFYISDLDQHYAVGEVLFRFGNTLLGLCVFTLRKSMDRYESDFDIIK